MLCDLDGIGRPVLHVISKAELRVKEHTKPPHRCRLSAFRTCYLACFELAKWMWITCSCQHGESRCHLHIRTASPCCPFAAMELVMVPSKRTLACRSVTNSYTHLARFSGQPCCRGRRTSLLGRTAFKAPCTSSVIREAACPFCNAFSTSCVRHVVRSVLAG